MGTELKKFEYKIHKRAGSVHVVLASHSTDEDGAILITPELMSEEEINAQIQLLKANLDNVGTRAKRALRNANTKPIQLFD